MKVKLFANAVRTSKEDQFKGYVTFTNQDGDQVKVDYICTNPESTMVDLLFTEKGESFHFNGVPSEELLIPFPDRQKWICFLTMSLVPGAIDLAKMLSHDTTQMMRLFEPDMSASGGCTGEINKKMYQDLFGAEILDNEKLVVIQKETGVPLRLLKKAKYSSFPEWGLDLTLKEVEEEFINAPEEGQEKDDVELLSIIKRLITLKS
jgi:hypothetical protein